jgi:hypothetical protein
MTQCSDQLNPPEVLQLLNRSLPYFLRSWRNFDDRCGLFGSVDPRMFNMRKVGSSSPVIEYVLRPHLQVLCILGAVLRAGHSQGGTSSDIESARERFAAGILWACRTHLTGDLKIDTFLERKQWGENWRSGLWAALLGIAGVLGKRCLDDSLLTRIQTVLAFEADRFIEVSPPSGYEIDTKLEENAQDVLALSWALAMVPQHPHADRWRESLAIWALNIATTIHDSADHSPCNGRSVAHWVSTQTLFPDMTAENHGFFHPEILSYGMYVVLAMAAFRLHGEPVPPFFRRENHHRTFELLLRFVLPNGLIYSPAAHDLPLFTPRPLALAWGLWHSDPRAISLTIRLLSWLALRMPESLERSVPWVFGFSGAGEGWELFFQSQVGFELAMLSVLPFADDARRFSSGQIENAVDTSKIYPFVETCYRRNTRTTRSMCWKALGKHPAIGITIHALPELLASFKASLLGVPSAGYRLKYAEVSFHEDRLIRDGFDSCGQILYYGPDRTVMLRRQVRALTWGDDGLLLFDRIVAERDIVFDEQYLSPLYIVNDIWTAGRIHLSSGSLSETISFDNSKSRVLSCPSFWASIEGYVLYQLIWGRGKGLCYVPGNQRNAPRYWHNCRLDMLGVHVEEQPYAPRDVIYEIGVYIGCGKGPRPFKSAGIAGDLFRGLVIMDGKNTVGLS